MPSRTDDSDDEKWYWDGTVLRLTPYLARLPDSCKEVNNQVDRVVRLGVTSNSKAQTCVHGRAHAYMLVHRALMTEGTWINPFPITGPTSIQIAACIHHAESQRVTLLAQWHLAAATSAASAPASAAPAPSSGSSAPAPASSPALAAPAPVPPPHLATAIVAEDQIPMTQEYVLGFADILSVATKLGQLICARCTSEAVTTPLKRLSADAEGISMLVYLNSIKIPIAIAGTLTGV